MAPDSPERKPTEHFRDNIFLSMWCHQVATQAVQELSNAGVQTWEFPQDTSQLPSCSMISTPPWQLMLYLLSTVSSVWKKWNSFSDMYSTKDRVEFLGYLVSYSNSSGCFVYADIKKKKCIILTLITIYLSNFIEIVVIFSDILLLP